MEVLQNQQVLFQEELSMHTSVNSLPSPSCTDGKKRRVCYYYDPDISNVDYGVEHVMVPRRVAMTHGLVASYVLLGEMRRLRTRPTTKKELLAFHDKDYVGLLGELTPDNYRRGGPIRSMAKARDIGRREKGFSYDDNPAIAGLWEYCARYAGGSLTSARALCSGASNIAINWSGGMHHACAGKASGFCYVNDIVLAIYELLGRFRRVLYVDIDAHHGDSVEKAFVESNRVMTVSFHQHGGDFFPRTGDIDDVGEGAGRYYSLNVPQKEGMDDQGYHGLFKPVVNKAIEVFDLKAVVLQCGADSLYGDRLARLNLSVDGHAECVRFLRNFNKPLLLLGGGGYTINHVASCWCYETAVAVGKDGDIADDIPHHGYDHYYKGQKYKLHYYKAASGSSMVKDTAHIRQRALEHLSKPEPVLSVQFEEQRGPAKGIDVHALYDDHPPSDDEEDPMERLHRLCGEADLVGFFLGLGKQQQLR